MANVWQRKCPLCFLKLEKVNPALAWKCDCGWTTDIEHKRRVYRGAPFDAVQHKREQADDE